MLRNIPEYGIMNIAECACLFIPECSAMFLNVPQPQTKGREGLSMAEYTIRDLMAISKTTDRAIRQLFDERKGCSNQK